MTERNFGAVAADYATHRLGFPDSLFDRLATLDVFRPGDRVIDVGAGTGTLARGFARRRCRVLGVDPDRRMIEQARRLDIEAGVSVDYRVGVAEALPVEDREADLISAGQCWHWFNGEAAANEFARVVRLGVRADRRQGRVLVAHFDWLPTPGSIVAATERLIVKHNPAWKGVGGDGIHTESLPPLWASGFRNFEMFGYDVDAAYTPEAWRGRVRASAGIGASLGSEAIAAFDAELAAILAAHFPGDVLKVPHRVWALTGVLG